MNAMLAKKSLSATTNAIPIDLCHIIVNIPPLPLIILALHVIFLDQPDEYSLATDP